jgi:hypothetical protein
MLFLLIFLVRVTVKKKKVKVPKRHFFLLVWGILQRQVPTI